MAAAGFLAALVPTHRAARIDPAATLRVYRADRAGTGAFSPNSRLLPLR